MPTYCSYAIVYIFTKDHLTDPLKCRLSAVLHCDLLNLAGLSKHSFCEHQKKMSVLCMTNHL